MEELTPTETSYFSQPAAGLDPRLFRDNKLIPKVRNSILQILLTHLGSKYNGSSGWAKAWLAGSGVSFSWAAHREPADLDCLVGVDFARFRESNMDFAGLSNKEIAQMLNEGFSEQLHPVTKEFMGSFELTFYVNQRAEIVELKPYAAYSLTYDDWTVFPQAVGIQENPEWEPSVERDRAATVEILGRYAKAMSKLESSGVDALRVNAKTELKLAMQQATALYEDIHSGRKVAFSDLGSGYADYHNYRWQAGKRSGAVQALKRLKESQELSEKEFAQSTYGTELPSASVLIRRAAAQRANR